MAGTSEFVGIELKLEGAAGVRDMLERIEDLKKSVEGRLEIKASTEQARKKVLELKADMDALRKTMENSDKGSDVYKSASKDLKELRQQSRLANTEMRILNKATQEATKIDNEIAKAQREAAREAERMAKEEERATREAERLAAQAPKIQTFGQAFNAASSRIAHAGSALQSFGNAMTQLTSPFKRLTNGIVMGAGYKVLNSFTEGFERGFTRYDTMKKYPKIMAAFGYSADEAEASIKALDLSVRGLPTGLDEMVDLAQRFTATTGDIEKGTQLAIAANNAFLASMSTDTQKYQGMMQLQDVLGGKDMNAREWNSLVSSMTPAIVKMGESLGYTSKNMDEWIQRVRDGKVDNEEFIDTLIKIGNEGGVLEAMARESKDTWQAFFANVGNAASRMMAKVITSMDEVVKALGLKDKDGNAIDSVNLLLSNKLIPNIDKMAVRVQKWIKAHPEEITNFFKDLASIDWGSLVRGYAKGMLTMIKLGERFVKLFSGKGLGAVGWFFGAGGGIGRVATILGGLLKGLRHPLAAIFALISKAGIGKLGIFGKIASIFGKKKDIEAAGDVGSAITTASPKLISAFKNMALLSGIVTMPAITGFVVTEALKKGVENFKEMITMFKDMDWSAAAKLAGGIVTFLGASAGLGALVGKFGVTGGTYAIIGETIVGLITAIASGFFAADMAMLTSGIKNFVKSINLLKDIPDVNTFGDVTSKIGNAITVMNDIASLIQGRYVDKMVKEGGIQGISFIKAAELTNLANGIEQLKKIAIKLNALAGITVNDPSQTIDDIKSACDKLQGIRGPEKLLQHATAVADALVQIKSMANSFNELAGISVNVDGFAAFVQQIKDALDELKGLSQTMKLDIKVVLGDGFRTSVNGVVKQINAGKKRIDDAMKKIPSAITKHISVTITASVNTRQAVAAITNGASYVEAIARQNRHRTINDAKGGLIYRAKGGGVPWKRRGTDTVPAMLTPGEYVHNKRAVSTFGIDFMRKVNNLDVKGAMNELMHRAGNMANVNRGTTINNYNNNQRVVINNNGNPGAGFTFKSASRFVGAI